MDKPDIPHYKFPTYQVGTGTYQTMIGTTPNMLNLFRIMNGLAEEKESIVIIGPSGVGKELVARGIAHHSAQHTGYSGLVTINTPLLAKETMESDLFGSQYGAFTGVKTREGKLGAAHKKTLFLDEVAELSLDCQAKLLRFLQDGTYTRVGGTEEQKADVRIIAATNRTLKDEVRAGRFREDLFYRLWRIGVAVPALNEHEEDIPFLVDHFMDRYARNYDRTKPVMSQEAMQVLQDYSYPGNVRELESIITKTMFMWRTRSNSQGEVLPDYVILDGLAINEADMKAPATAKKAFDPNVHGELGHYLITIEKEQIIKALAAHDWNIKQAGDYLGVNRSTLSTKIKNYGITCKGSQN
jgi:DNA-binding NtrC family response regulator